MKRGALAVVGLFIFGIGCLVGHVAGHSDAMNNVLTRCFDQNAKLISTVQTKTGVQCNFASGLGYATFRRNASK